jgi:hydroxyacylglutathione hydrolase
VNKDTSIHVLHPGAYMQSAAYLLVGSGGVVLIDPGSGSGRAQILQKLHVVDCSPADIHAVLLTHCHADHVLGVPFYRDQGAAVMCSEWCAQTLRSGDREIWAEHAELIRPMPVDRVLEDGSTIWVSGMRIGCVALPGHTPGGMAYLIENRDGRSAFIGDLLTDQAQPGWAGPTYSPEDTTESLKHLLSLHLDHIYWGHGRIEGDVDEWLQRGLEIGERHDAAAMVAAWLAVSVAKGDVSAVRQAGIRILRELPDGKGTALVAKLARSRDNNHRRRFMRIAKSLTGEHAKQQEVR